MGRSSINGGISIAISLCPVLLAWILGSVEDKMTGLKEWTVELQLWYSNQVAASKKIDQFYPVLHEFFQDDSIDDVFPTIFIYFPGFNLSILCRQTSHHRGSCCSARPGFFLPTHESASPSGNWLRLHQFSRERYSRHLQRCSAAHHGIALVPLVPPKRDVMM